MKTLVPPLLFTLALAPACTQRDAGPPSVKPEQAEVTQQTFRDDADGTCSSNQNRRNEIAVRPNSTSTIKIGKGAGSGIGSTSGSWCCTSTSEQTFDLQSSNTSDGTTYSATYQSWNGEKCDGALSGDQTVQSGDTLDFCVTITSSTTGESQTLTPGGDPIVLVAPSSCGDDADI